MHLTMTEGSRIRRSAFTGSDETKTMGFLLGSEPAVTCAAAEERCAGSSVTAHPRADPSRFIPRRRRAYNRAPLVPTSTLCSFPRSRIAPVGRKTTTRSHERCSHATKPRSGSAPTQEQSTHYRCRPDGHYPTPHADATKVTSQQICIHDNRANSIRRIWLKAPRDAK